MLSALIHAIINSKELNYPYSFIFLHSASNSNRPNLVQTITNQIASLLSCAATAATAISIATDRYHQGTKVTYMIQVGRVLSGLTA
jgi:hypothetical protein